MERARLPTSKRNTGLTQRASSTKTKQKKATKSSCPHQPWTDYVGPLFMVRSKQLLLFLSRLTFVPNDAVEMKATQLLPSPTRVKISMADMSRNFYSGSSCNSFNMILRLGLRHSSIKSCWPLNLSITFPSGRCRPYHGHNRAESDSAPGMIWRLPWTSEQPCSFDDSCWCHRPMSHWYPERACAGVACSQHEPGLPNAVQRHQSKLWTLIPLRCFGVHCGGGLDVHALLGNLLALCMRPVVCVPYVFCGDTI